MMAKLRNTGLLATLAAALNFALIYESIAFARVAKTNSADREIRIILEKFENGWATIHPDTYSNPEGGRWLGNPEPNQKVRFWGLGITDGQAVNTFLTGRPLSCLVLYEHEYQLTVDCKASPVASREFLLRGSLIDWMNLYVVLTQFNFATPTCDERDALASITSEKNNAIYKCDEGGNSIRSRGIRFE